MGELQLLNNTQKFRKTKKGILTNSYFKQKSRKEVNYSLSELHDKFMNDEKFNRLYNEWVKSGFKKEMKPTVDRINAKRPYSLDNVHALSWEENRYKQRMELKLLRARPVYAIVNDEVVHVFKSVSHAVKVTGIKQGNISSCLNGSRKSAGGFNWSYENPELLAGDSDAI